MNNARPSRSCSHPTCRAHRCSLHRWPSTRHMPCLLFRHSAQRLRPPNMQMDATPECIRTQARVLVCKGLTTVALAPGADQRKVIHSLAHPSTHSRIICEPHQMYGRYVQTPSRGNGNVALQPHILSAAWHCTGNRDVGRTPNHNGLGASAVRNHANTPHPRFHPRAFARTRLPAQSPAATSPD